jgi:hypothetical protein
LVPVLQAWYRIKTSGKASYEYIEKGFTVDANVIFFAILYKSVTSSEILALYRKNNAYITRLFKFGIPNLKELYMKTMTTPKEGLWIMVEEPIEEPTENTQPAQSDSFRDTYDYFPDFGI